MTTFESGYEPHLVHSLPHRMGGSRKKADIYIPFPPMPASLKPSHLSFTQNQIKVLYALAEWHWRFAPSHQNLHTMTRLRSPRIVQAALDTLRAFGFIEWLDGEPRTLHLTPRGQWLCGISIGAVRTAHGTPLTSYTVDSSPTGSRANGQQRAALKRLWHLGQKRPELRRVPQSQVEWRQWKRRRTLFTWPPIFPDAQPNVAMHILYASSEDT